MLVDLVHQLDDRLKFKDVLVAKVLTDNLNLLQSFFFNQIGSLNTIHEANKKEECTQEQVLKCNPNKGHGNKCLTKHTLLDFSSEGDSSSTMDSASSVPLNKVGANGFYDPYLNANFGGAYFNLVHNKLVQLEVYNVEHKLIAPWTFYNALKPGTLVLICASLHCYIMKERLDIRKVSTYHACIQLAYS
ncbi:hypothetical protein C0995_006239 [Termitomyces sp. Mi166|nr:hypothetical protein C0995_006239 [Termitomyces sp. Mi166\